MLLDQRLEDRIRSLGIELDVDFRPEIVRKVVEGSPCRHGHEERCGLFVDGEFGDGDRVRNHLDGPAEVERSDEDRAAAGAPLQKTSDARNQDGETEAETRLVRVKRRAPGAGLSANVSCHTFRATGITAYLENGGSLENAQKIAAHESPRTTKLYDRTNDQLTLDEIERIVI